VSLNAHFALEVSLSSSCTRGSQLCLISVAFVPSKEGAITGSLIVTDSVTGLASSVKLAGVGLAMPPPVVTPPSLTPSSLDFGSEEIGLTSTPQMVTAVSQNQDAMTPQVQPMDSYNLTQGATCAQGLPSCQIAVRFSLLKQERSQVP